MFALTFTGMRAFVSDVELREQTEKEIFPAPDPRLEFGRVVALPPLRRAAPSPAREDFPLAEDEGDVRFGVALIREEVVEAAVEPVGANEVEVVHVGGRASCLGVKARAQTLVCRRGREVEMRNCG